MKMINVKSSNIKAIGWGVGVLRICFIPERYYDYLNVPKQVYLDFLESKSKGKYFSSEIKNVYNCVRPIDVD